MSAGGGGGRLVTTMTGLRCWLGVDFLHRNANSAKRHTDLRTSLEA